MRVSRAKRLLAAGLLAALVSGCDQASKLQAVAQLTDTLHGATSSRDKVTRILTVQHPRAVRRVTAVDGYWDFAYVENPGAAFSSFRSLSPDLARPLLTGFGLLALGFLILFLSRTTDAWALFGGTLIVGGAVGNLVDRIRLGYVIDFIYWHWKDSFHWPVFNLADAAISVGIGLLLVRELRRGLAARRAQARAVASPRP